MPAVITQQYTKYIQAAVYFSGFLFWGCHGQVGGTRFQVSMTGADQRRYLRPDE